MLAIILGGGRGTRLFPLTLKRSKPAVPIGGKYRLIDIPISNCLNAGLRQIFVLTQFNSESLNRHVAMTYKFDVFSSAFVSVLAAEQTEEGGNWFQGTADAVRQSLRHMRRTPARDMLILSGDQLYSMDYAQMLETHRESGADATVAVIPVAAEQTSAFGILKMDSSGRIVHFDEKPPRRAAARAASELPGGGTGYLASMGIYLFKREVAGAGGRQPEARRLRPPRHPRRRCRASACRRTSTAATGRTSGPSSRTSRPTWRCASAIPPFDFYDAKRPDLHAPALPAGVEAGGLQHPERPRSPRAASCTAPRSTARSSASAAASARGAQIRNSLLDRRRLLRDAGRDARDRGARRPAGRHRRRLDHRERDHRQERAHRPRRAHHQRGGHQEKRRRRLLHPRRDRHRPQERRHPPNGTVI